MQLKDTLTEIKFYYRHIAAVGCLTTLFVYIYYANAAKNSMNDAHKDNLNVYTDAVTSLDNSVYSFKINNDNMNISFGVAVILALTAMSIQHDTTKLFKSSPLMKKFNNWLRLFIAVGVIAALISFIYYSDRTIYWRKKAADDGGYNHNTAAYTNLPHDTKSFQSDQLNAQISLEVAIILSLIVLAIKEY